MMSTLQANVPTASATGARGRTRWSGHKIRVILAASASFLLLAWLAIYGASYYVLPLNERPYSPKHHLLRPSGAIGLKLGFLGVILFCIIFLYALRKVIPWLGRLGTARHWMDFHVIAGVTAPFVIAFHASFKFQGIAGFAFWIMVAVALSGIVGRYLYSKIPRSLSAAELSLRDLQTSEAELAQALLEQSVYSAGQLKRILKVPSADKVRQMGTLRAVGGMIAFDIMLPFQVAGLRRASSTFAETLLCFGGLLACRNRNAEEVVRLVRQKVSLSRRIVFLNQTHRVFHLWHVVHRPFSYAFVLLAVLHIAVVMGLGFAGYGLR